MVTVFVHYAEFLVSHTTGNDSVEWLVLHSNYHTGHYGYFQGTVSSSN